MLSPSDQGSFQLVAPPSPRAGASRHHHSVKGQTENIFKALLAVQGNTFNIAIVV